MSCTQSKPQYGPYQPSEIPDRWDFIHNPRGIDERTAQIQYNPDASKYNPVSCIYLITPQSNDVDSIVVEVQDKNAEKSVMGKALPVAENESFDEMDAALQRIYEFAEEYPLPETREGGDTSMYHNTAERPYDLSLTQAESIASDVRAYDRVLTAEIISTSSESSNSGYAVGFVFDVLNGCEAIGEIHTPSPESILPEVQSEPSAD